MNLADLPSWRPRRDADPRFGVTTLAEEPRVERWEALLGQASDDDILAIAVRPHYSWRDIARLFLQLVLATRAQHIGRRPV